MFLNAPDADCVMDSLLGNTTPNCSTNIFLYLYHMMSHPAT